jgi:hypothetical protein
MAALHRDGEKTVLYPRQWSSTMIETLISFSLYDFHNWFKVSDISLGEMSICSHHEIAFFRVKLFPVVPSGY